MADFDRTGFEYLQPTQFIDIWRNLADCATASWNSVNKLPHDIPMVFFVVLVAIPVALPVVIIGRYINTSSLGFFIKKPRRVLLVGSLYVKYENQLSKYLESTDYSPYLGTNLYIVNFKVDKVLNFWLLRFKT